MAPNLNTQFAAADSGDGQTDKASTETEAEKKARVDLVLLQQRQAFLASKAPEQPIQVNFCNLTIIRLLFWADCQSPPLPRNPGKSSFLGFKSSFRVFRSGFCSFKPRFCFFDRFS